MLLGIDLGTGSAKALLLATPKIRDQLPRLCLNGSAKITYRFKLCEGQRLPASGERDRYSVVGRVMASSTDASHQKKVSEHDPNEAAEMFLNASRDSFSYQDEWWQLGINGNGDIVGFVLPVIFEGCAKEGLWERPV